MKKTTMRWYAVALFAFVAIGIIYVGHHRGRAEGSAAPPAVKTAAARVGVFTVRVSAHGRVGPPPGSQASLAFPIAGRISTFEVRVGDRVAAGQALAELDTTGLTLSVAQARGDAKAAAGGYGGGAVPSAALQSAQAKLMVARANLARLESGGPGAQSDRIAAQAAQRQAELKVQSDVRTLQRDQALFAAGVLAAKDVQAAQTQLAADRADAESARAKAQAATAGTSSAIARARADYAQAQSDVAAAQAQGSVLGGQAARAQAALAEAERNLANGTLRAPSSGVVVAILKHPGESVDPTMPVIQIGAGSEETATLSVPAGDARQVRVRNSVDLRLPRSQQSGRGHVIGVVPSVDPLTQQSTVIVNGVPKSAASGDAVEASIVVATHSGVIVPASAIVQDPQSGKTLVFVQSNRNGSQRFQPREIVVRASDEKTAELRRGLQAGETVAAEGAYELLAPGAGG
ncbi:MAG: efflux RND transporter periplasmic adaptor subunit [Candidatus Eremiobacteraeota bacterium]|nr:efflux RND transporter periplasmic adaptor subunit [Candidatus Eremiobacteraeota bacterium]